MRRTLVVTYLNYHEDFSSMIMASGFALAMAAYTFALYFADPQPQPKAD